MSARMNGYDSGRIPRPSSEQMVDLHVYLVPPDIWREKFNNALNQNINDTVSIGFIRVHPETKVYQLRDEIEQQLGSDLIPREYVFVKSVGRSLTRLKSRQEATLKAKTFLPPQAYAPELYLLEATPEVRQAIAASENSTRPQTRTSYDYEYTAKSDDGLHHAKYSNMPNGAGYQSHYQTLPQITSRNENPEAGRMPPESSRVPDTARRASPASVASRSLRSPPVVTKTAATPRDMAALPDNNRDLYHGKNRNFLDTYRDDGSGSHTHTNHSYHEENGTDKFANRSIQEDSGNSKFVKHSYNEENNTAKFENQSYQEDNVNSKFAKRSYGEESTNSPSEYNVNRPPRDLRNRQTFDSDPPVDLPQHQMVSSPRRVPQQDEYLPPLSATPPHSDNEKHKSGGHHGNRYKHDEDSGIAGFTPETYRENDVLDRRKADGDATDRLQPPVIEQGDNSYRSNQQDGNDQDDSEWERQRREEEERRRREEEERRRREEEEQRKQDQERENEAQEAKMRKTTSDEDLSRFPSPPPLRLASPDRDTESAKARRRQQKEALLRELEEAREARRNAERQREELVKNAKQMQSKTQNRRNHARDLWKKRYFEEKKKTGPLEEQSNRLRHELDIIHKRLLSTLEGPKEKSTKLGDLKSPKVGANPKPVNNFKIQATRLQHEIEDIRRRVEHAKMKLTGEMKLRNQAETELRALRAELVQKKINLTLSRNSHLTTYAPPAADVNFMTARSAITPRS